ncbi:MAG TPA: MATE family efflux transporter [Fibrobacteria bacterium]|nr:MATE family efflux transporter [Fibrobacteria bacterium]HOX51795.1 MATE family efflux transporter [Fibrobacteria bacterium]
MASHLRPLFGLAAPLILSSTSVTAMQVIDALVVARHSAEAVAALGTSSMAVVLVQGVLFGTAGYCGTFAAHHHGARDQGGVFRSAWLGIHTSWLSGLIGMVLALFLPEIFRWAGHGPQILEQEILYTRICLAGSLFPVLSSALSGWLAGIGKTPVVTVVTLGSFLVNAILAWILVLGRFGAPAMGLEGAAWATVASQGFASLLYLAIFAGMGGFKSVQPRVTWAQMRHFLELALPWGLRISGEVLAWTVFLVFMGRMGTLELAATTAAFRINSIAFFPAMGLAQATGILVGQARGAGRDHEVPGIGFQGLALAEGWMLVLAATFVWGGPWLSGWFHTPGPQGAAIVDLVTVSLRYVALYCLFDASNVLLSSVLSATGDTRWVAKAYGLGSLIFLGALWINDHLSGGYHAAWILAVVFILATATAWAFRFASGAWKNFAVLGESETLLVRPTDMEPVGSRPKEVT